MNDIFFNNQNFETVTTLDPIVTREVNVVNRYYLVCQPHIHQVETKYCDHIVKRHTCEVVTSCSNECDYVEENCCNNGLFNF